MSGFSGANTERLAEIEMSVTSVLGRLDGALASEPRFVSNLRVAWTGADASDFLSGWSGVDRPALDHLATSLRAMSDTLRSNRLAQEETSLSGTGIAPRFGGTVPIRGLAPNLHEPPVVPVESETFTIDGSAHAFLGIVGTNGSGEVTITRMSDGTYLVSVAAGAELGAGIGIDRIAKSAGLNVFGDIGIDVESSNGWQLEFAVTDEATARELSEAFQGRASSLSNRFFGGIDQSEIAGQSLLDHPSISFSSLTELHAGVSAGGSGEIGLWGIDAEMGSQNATVYNADGTVTHRTVVDTDLSQTGWNMDSVSEGSVLEVTVDSDGNVVSAMIEQSTVHATDTRGGVEKGWDTIVGLTPGIDLPSTEFDLQTSVERLEFSADTMPQEMLNALQDGDRSKLAFLAEEHADLARVTNLEFDGTSHTGGLSLNAGIVGAGNTTTHGGLDMTSGSVTYPGSDAPVDLVDLEDHGMNAQRVVEADGSESIVWTGKF